MCIKQVLGASSLFLEGYHFAFSSFFSFSFQYCDGKTQVHVTAGKGPGIPWQREDVLSPGSQWEFRWFGKY